MLYPLKFEPVYKDYLWGGRNLEKLGKTLPEGKVAESWEVSAHPDGTSIIANGEYKGLTLAEFLEKFGERAIGSALSADYSTEFPLLVKFIDANDKLSVQVHPTDEYVQAHEGGYGKNEMWYVIEAEPGAKLIYGLKAGVDKEQFAQAIKDGTISSLLQTVEVNPGDVFDIPAGLVHGIGEGILLAEIQQSSNLTYRIYDYDRVDAQGNKRPLHVDKALEVIDFSAKASGKLRPELQDVAPGVEKATLVAKKYFVVELYKLTESHLEEARDRFFIYTFLKGEGTITYSGGKLDVQGGESVFIPAALGQYRLEGELEGLKTHLPS